MRRNPCKIFRNRQKTELALVPCRPPGEEAPRLWKHNLAIAELRESFCPPTLQWYIGKSNFAKTSHGNWPAASRTPWGKWIKVEEKSRGLLRLKPSHEESRMWLDLPWPWLQHLSCIYRSIEEAARTAQQSGELAKLDGWSSAKARKRQTSPWPRGKKLNKSLPASDRIPNILITPPRTPKIFKAHVPPAPSAQHSGDVAK